MPALQRRTLMSVDTLLDNISCGKTNHLCDNRPCTADIVLELGGVVVSNQESGRHAEIERFLVQLLVDPEKERCLRAASYYTLRQLKARLSHAGQQVVHDFSDFLVLEKAQDMFRLAKRMN
jgi:hypothetical protein